MEILPSNCSSVQQTETHPLLQPQFSLWFHGLYAWIQELFFAFHYSTLHQKVHSFF